MANPRRVEKLQRQILRSIANAVLFESADPRMAAQITFTRVKLARDLSFARIYYSVLGNESQKRTAGKFLEHSRGRLRRKLGDDMSTRIIPEIEFIYDPAVEGAIEVAKTLHQLEEEREADGLDGGDLPSGADMPDNGTEGYDPATDDANDPYAGPDADRVDRN